MKGRIFKTTALILVISMSLLSIIPPVDASMVETEVVLKGISQRDMDLQKLQRFLESKIVKQKLKALGYSPYEIKQRLEALNDEDLHVLATKVDGIRVAGDSGLGIIVMLLIIAILVVVLLQLTGHRIVVVKD
jgi:hypothetical protein